MCDRFQVEFTFPVFARGQMLVYLLRVAALALLLAIIAPVSAAPARTAATHPASPTVSSLELSRLDVSLEAEPTYREILRYWHSLHVPSGGSHPVPPVEANLAFGNPGKGIGTVQITSSGTLSREASLGPSNTITSNLPVSGRQPLPRANIPSRTGGAVRFSRSSKDVFVTGPGSRTLTFRITNLTSSPVPVPSLELDHNPSPNQITVDNLNESSPGRLAPGERTNVTARISVKHTVEETLPGLIFSLRSRGLTTDKLRVNLRSGASDPAVFSKDITVSSPSPEPGSTIAISAVVRNLGQQSAPDVPVSITFNGTPIHETQLDLDSGEQRKIRTEATIPSSGTPGSANLVDVRIKSDPATSARTQQTINNHASRVVTVGGARGGLPLSYGITVRGSLDRTTVRPGGELTWKGDAVYSFDNRQQARGSPVTAWVENSRGQILWTTAWGHTNRYGKIDPFNFNAPRTPGRYFLYVRVTDMTLSGVRAFPFTVGRSGSVVTDPGNTRSSRKCGLNIRYTGSNLFRNPPGSISPGEDVRLGVEIRSNQSNQSIQDPVVITVDNGTDDPRHIKLHPDEPNDRYLYHTLDLHAPEKSTAVTVTSRARTEVCRRKQHHTINVLKQSPSNSATDTNTDSACHDPGCWEVNFDRPPLIRIGDTFDLTLSIEGYEASSKLTGPVTMTVRNGTSDSTVYSFDVEPNETTSFSRTVRLRAPPEPSTMKVTVHAKTSDDDECPIDGQHLIDVVGFEENDTTPADSTPPCKITGSIDGPSVTEPGQPVELSLQSQVPTESRSFEPPIHVLVTENGDTRLFTFDPDAPRSFEEQLNLNSPDTPGLMTVELTTRTKDCRFRTTHHVTVEPKDDPRTSCEEAGCWNVSFDRPPKIEPGESFDVTVTVDRSYGNNEIDSPVTLDVSGSQNSPRTIAFDVGPNEATHLERTVGITARNNPSTIKLTLEAATTGDNTCPIVGNHQINVSDTPTPLVRNNPCNLRGDIKTPSGVQPGDTYDVTALGEALSSGDEFHNPVTFRVDDGVSAPDTFTVDLIEGGTNESFKGTLLGEAPDTSTNVTITMTARTNRCDLTRYASFRVKCSEPNADILLSHPRTVEPGDTFDADVTVDVKENAPDLASPVEVQLKNHTTGEVNTLTFSVNEGEKRYFHRVLEDLKAPSKPGSYSITVTATTTDPGYCSFENATRLSVQSSGDSPALEPCLNIDFYGTVQRSDWNKIKFQSTPAIDTAARYRFGVTERVKPHRSIDSYSDLMDRILSPVRAEGWITGGRDWYLYTSEITDISVEPGIATYVNGEPVDPDSLNGYGNPVPDPFSSSLTTAPPPEKVRPGETFPIWFEVDALREGDPLSDTLTVNIDYGTGDTEQRTITVGQNKDSKFFEKLTLKAPNVSSTIRVTVLGRTESGCTRLGKHTIRVINYPEEPDPPVPPADLVVHSEDIQFSTFNFEPNEPLTFYATIHNNGNQDVPRARVEFFDEEPHLSKSKQLGTDYVSIPANGSQVARVRGTPDPSHVETLNGDSRVVHVIDVRASPVLGQKEADPHDNEASRALLKFDTPVITNPGNPFPGPDQPDSPDRPNSGNCGSLTMDIEHTQPDQNFEKSEHPAAGKPFDITLGASGDESLPHPRPGMELKLLIFRSAQPDRDKLVQEYDVVHGRQLGDRVTFDGGSYTQETHLDNRGRYTVRAVFVCPSGGMSKTQRQIVVTDRNPETSPKPETTLPEAHLWVGTPSASRDRSTYVGPGARVGGYARGGESIESLKLTAGTHNRRSNGEDIIFNTDRLAEGTHDFSVTATNSTGVSTSKERTIHVDRTSPSLETDWTGTKISRVGDTYVVGSGVTLTVEGRDVGSHRSGIKLLTYTWNDQQPDTRSPTLSIESNSLPNGTYTLNVSAVDAVSNRSSRETIQIRVDRTAFTTGSSSSGAAFNWRSFNHAPEELLAKTLDRTESIRLKRSQGDSVITVEQTNDVYRVRPLRDVLTYEDFPYVLPVHRVSQLYFLGNHDALSLSVLHDDRSIGLEGQAKLNFLDVPDGATWKLVNEEAALDSGTWNPHWVWGNDYDGGVVTNLNQPFDFTITPDHWKGIDQWKLLSEGPTMATLPDSGTTVSDTISKITVKLDGMVDVAKSEARVVLEEINGDRTWSGTRNNGNLEFVNSRTMVLRVNEVLGDDRTEEGTYRVRTTLTDVDGTSYEDRYRFRLAPVDARIRNVVYERSFEAVRGRLEGLDRIDGLSLYEYEDSARGPRIAADVPVDADGRFSYPIEDLSESVDAVMAVAFNDAGEVLDTAVVPYRPERLRESSNNSGTLEIRSKFERPQIQDKTIDVRVRAGNFHEVGIELSVDGGSYRMVARKQGLLNEVGWYYFEDLRVPLSARTVRARAVGFDQSGNRLATSQPVEYVRKTLAGIQLRDRTDANVDLANAIAADPGFGIVTFGTVGGSNANPDDPSFDPSSGESLKVIPPSENNATIKVFTLRGRLIRTLQGSDGEDVQWHGRNEQGQLVSNGPYLVRIHSGSEVKTFPVMVVK